MYTIILITIIFTAIVSAIPLPVNTNEPRNDETAVNMIAKPKGVVQSDMKLTPSQLELFENLNENHGIRKRRAALGLKEYLWHGGIVPVKFATIFTKSEKDFIREQMKKIEDGSCIKFEVLDESETRPDYIHVSSDDGCWSQVGRTGGKREMSLSQDGCLTERIVPHEFLHALGFFHEHSRPDRDSYVEILTDNILPGDEDQFSKYSTVLVNSRGEAYEYASIMHYKRYAFSKNGYDTIRPLDPNYTGVIGGNHMTEGDLKQLNLLYECEQATTTTSTTTSTMTTTSESITIQKPTTTIATETTTKPTAKTTQTTKTLTMKPTTTATKATKTTTTTTKPTATESTSTANKATTTTIMSTLKPTQTTIKPITEQLTTIMATTKAKPATTEIKTIENNKSIAATKPTTITTPPSATISTKSTTPISNSTSSTSLLRSLMLQKD